MKKDKRGDKKVKKYMRKKGYHLLEKIAKDKKNPRQFEAIAVLVAQYYGLL